MGASRGLQDNIPSIVKGSATTVTLAATNNGQPTRITIGGQQYKVASTLTMTTSTSGINGLDTGSIAANTLYYVYAVVSSSVIGLIASVTAPTTGPTGFAGRYKLLGRFRTDFAGTSVNTVAPDASIGMQGAVVSDWQSFTPTIAASGGGAVLPTTYTLTAKYRRVGSNAEIQLSYINSSNAGASSGSGSYYTVSLPSGLTIDSTKIVTGVFVGNQLAGGATAYDPNTTNDFEGHVVALDTTTLGVAVVAEGVGVAGAWGPSGYLPLANPSGIRIGFEASIPIAEWAGLFT